MLANLTTDCYRRLHPSTSRQSITSTSNLTRYELTPPEPSSADNRSHTPSMTVTTPGNPPMYIGGRHEHPMPIPPPISNSQVLYESSASLSTTSLPVILDSSGPIGIRESPSTGIFDPTCNGDHLSSPPPSTAGFCRVKYPKLTCCNNNCWHPCPAMRPRYTTQPQYHHHHQFKIESPSVFDYCPPYPLLQCHCQAVAPLATNIGCGSYCCHRDEALADVADKDRKPCDICGDVSAGYHCNAYVCEACKKFFIRSSKKDNFTKYTCAKSNECEVNRDTRTHCQRCRYEKCLRVGMVLPSEAIFPVTDISEIPCRVCGVKSSGFHFGAITCEGCKGFFRRTINERESQRYACRNGDKCLVTGTTRNNCKSCRYRRCLAVGMSKDGSRIGRQPNAVKHRCAIEIEHIRAGMTSHPRAPSTPSSTLVASSPIPVIGQLESLKHVQQTGDNDQLGGSFDNSDMPASIGETIHSSHLFDEQIRIATQHRPSVEDARNTPFNSFADTSSTEQQIYQTCPPYTSIKNSGKDNQRADLSSLVSTNSQQALHVRNITQDTSNISPFNPLPPRLIASDNTAADSFYGNTSSIITSSSHLYDITHDTNSTQRLPISNYLNPTVTTQPIYPFIMNQAPTINRNLSVNENIWINKTQSSFQHHDEIEYRQTNKTQLLSHDNITETFSNRSHDQSEHSTTAGRCGGRDGLFEDITTGSRSSSWSSDVLESPVTLQTPFPLKSADQSLRSDWWINNTQCRPLLGQLTSSSTEVEDTVKLHSKPSQSYGEQVSMKYWRWNQEHSQNYQSASRLNYMSDPAFGQSTNPIHPSYSDQSPHSINSYRPEQRMPSPHSKFRKIGASILRNSNSIESPPIDPLPVDSTPQDPTINSTSSLIGPSSCDLSPDDESRPADICCNNGCGQRRLSTTYSNRQSIVDQSTELQYNASTAASEQDNSISSATELSSDQLQSPCHYSEIQTRLYEDDCRISRFDTNHRLHSTAIGSNNSFTNSSGLTNEVNRQLTNNWSPSSHHLPISCSDRTELNNNQKAPTSFYSSSKLSSRSIVDAGLEFVRGCRHVVFNRSSSHTSQSIDNLWSKASKRFEAIHTEVNKLCRACLPSITPTSIQKLTVNSSYALILLVMGLTYQPDSIDFNRFSLTELERELVAIDLSGSRSIASQLRQVGKLVFRFKVTDEECGLLCVMRLLLVEQLLETDKNITQVFNQAKANLREYGLANDPSVGRFDHLTSLIQHQSTLLQDPILSRQKLHSQDRNEIAGTLCCLLATASFTAARNSGITL